MGDRHFKDARARYDEQRALVEARLAALRRGAEAGEHLRAAYDFSVPGERARYERNRKRYRRELALPRDRRCPRCRIVKTESRRWVRHETGDPRRAVCLSCHRRRPRGHVENFLADRWLDGAALKRTREALGVSSDDFAALCGWGGRRQRYLERYEDREVRDDTARALTRAVGRLLG